ncbi:MAG: hypothetical protein DMG13_10520 [Acidobacteria bacterium]|nr:MAG: hypothetical protein DMG13_10520 [Acidobacteriota bacterium]
MNSHKPFTRAYRERSIKLVVAGLLIIGWYAAVTPVLAHHSGAMFDQEKVKEVTGTVKEFQWKNPHVWIQINVKKLRWCRGRVERRGWWSEFVVPAGLAPEHLQARRHGDGANQSDARWLSGGGICRGEVFRWKNAGPVELSELPRSTRAKARDYEHAETFLLTS